MTKTRKNMKIKVSIIGVKWFIKTFREKLVFTVQINLLLRVEQINNKLLGQILEIK